MSIIEAIETVVERVTSAFVGNKLIADHVASKVCLKLETMADVELAMAMEAARHAVRAVPGRNVRRKVYNVGSTFTLMKVKATPDSAKIDRTFIGLCKGVTDYSSRAFKSLMHSGHMVLRAEFDSVLGWRGCGYTDEEFLDLWLNYGDIQYHQAHQKLLNEPVDTNLYVPQLLKTSMPGGGGGMSSSGAGVFMYADRDIVAELYREHWGVDPSKFSAKDLISRLSLLFKMVWRFNEVPLIGFTDVESGGAIDIDADFADKATFVDEDGNPVPTRTYTDEDGVIHKGVNGVDDGDKGGGNGIKGTYRRVDGLREKTGYDVLLYKDTVKVDGVRADVERLAQSLGIAPDLRARERSSWHKEPRRMPGISLHTLLFIPGAVEVLMKQKHVRNSLAWARKVLLNQVSGREIADTLLTYENELGGREYRKEGVYMLAGQGMDEPRIKKAVLASLGTYLMNALTLTVRGYYAVLLGKPDHVRGKKVVIVIHPLMMPVVIEADDSDKGVIKVDLDFIKAIGKDIDGDGASVYYADDIRRLGIDTSKMLEWGRDNAAIVKAFTMPAKAKVDDPRKGVNVILDFLCAQMNIGIMANRVSVLTDLKVNHLKKSTKEASLGYGVDYATYVQPHVDSLKYVTAKGWLPTLLDFVWRGTKTRKDGSVEQVSKTYPGMATQAGIPNGLAEQLVQYFQVVTAMRFEEVTRVNSKGNIVIDPAFHSLIENPELNGFFWYELWKALAMPELVIPAPAHEVAKFVLSKHPCGSQLNRRLQASIGSRMTKIKAARAEGHLKLQVVNTEVTAERLKEFESELQLPGVGIGILANCVARKDWRLARAVADHIKVDIRDVYRIDKELDRQKNTLLLTWNQQ